MKKTNPILSLLSLLSLVIFLKPEIYPLFAKIARILLLVIVFSRPLADIFSKTKLWIYLRKIVCIRQWIWVMCWMFALAHGIWYFLSINFQFLTIFSSLMAYIHSILTKNVYLICSKHFHHGQLRFYQWFVLFTAANWK